MHFRRPGLNKLCILLEEFTWSWFHVTFTALFQEAVAKGGWGSFRFPFCLLLPFLIHHFSFVDLIVSSLHRSSHHESVEGGSLEAEKTSLTTTVVTYTGLLMETCCQFWAIGYTEGQKRVPHGKRNYLVYWKMTVFLWLPSVYYCSFIYLLFIYQWLDARYCLSTVSSAKFVIFNIISFCLVILIHDWVYILLLNTYLQ